MSEPRNASNFFRRTRELGLIKGNFHDFLDRIESLTRQHDELLEALEKMNRAYVGLMENGRDRIIALGGDCDPVDVMERSDPHLRESRAVIARVKGGAA